MANNVVELQRWTRYLAECYSNPTQFASPADYLAALTECLDEFCLLHKIEPPRIEGVFDGR